MNLHLVVALFMSVFVLSSCSSIEKDRDSREERRSIEGLYQTSGIAKYFLPQMPDWANRSEVAACLREEQVQYIDMKSFRQSLGLSYAAGLQFQLGHTQRLKSVRKSVSRDNISAKEAEQLFYTALDRVKSGIHIFRVPRYERVHLIWVDQALKSEAATDQLLKLMNSQIMQQGHPVFVSLCASQDQLEDFVVKNKIDDRNIRLLSQELFSPFDPEMNLLPYDRVFLDFVFSQDQKLHLFSPNAQKLEELEGSYEVHSFN